MSDMVLQVLPVLAYALVFTFTKGFSGESSDLLLQLSILNLAALVQIGTV